MTHPAIPTRPAMPPRRRQIFVNVATVVAAVVFGSALVAGVTAKPQPSHLAIAFERADTPLLAFAVVGPWQDAAGNTVRILPLPSGEGWAFEDTIGPDVLRTRNLEVRDGAFYLEGQPLALTRDGRLQIGASALMYPVPQE